MRGDAAHHLGRVLRAQPGQIYELSDGQTVWLGRVARVEPDAIEFALLEEVPSVTPTFDLTLLLSIVKFDAFEWAIEKAAELGVSRIVPLAAARSEKTLVTAAAKRSERWQRILYEAAQQSRRVQAPELLPAAKAATAFAGVGSSWKLIFSENPDAPPLSRFAASAASPACLAIGPEGGWTEQEMEAARQAGFQDVALGKLILRTETAVVSALAVLNYLLGAARGLD